MKSQVPKITLLASLLSASLPIARAFDEWTFQALCAPPEYYDCMNPDGINGDTYIQAESIQYSPDYMCIKSGGSAYYISNASAQQNYEYGPLYGGWQTV